MVDLENIQAALRTERTIDIVTLGERTGLSRPTEIWFTNIAGRIIICGAPSTGAGRGERAPRDWLANLVAQPAFEFCLKESIQAKLTATATPVRELKERRAVMSAAQTRWYREQGFSVDELVAGTPIVDVVFTGVFLGLNG